MVSGDNLEKLGSCSTTCMVSVLACGNKWIQVGKYTNVHDHDVIGVKTTKVKTRQKLGTWKYQTSDI